MNTKRIWATTDTGWKWHAFEGGSARCRKNIRPRMYAVMHDDFRTLDQVQELFTDADICPKCLASALMEEQANRSLLNQAHAEALEMDKDFDCSEKPICASQTRDPRTGRISYCIKPEGHYSPLYSEQVQAAEHQPHPTHDRAKEMTEALEMDKDFDCTDINIDTEPASEDTEPVCICSEFGSDPSNPDVDHHIVCPLRATDTKETDDMADETRTFTGPLTPVQTQALKYLSQGLRHGEIGGHYTPARSKEHVSQVLTAARRKMGAQTATEAACMVATAEAYLSAAEMIETDRPLHPESDETDEHVWHVMTGLAKTLRERAAALLPK